MTCVNANGIQIEYETFGDKTNPTIVLISWNGAQLNFWEPDFCGMLVKENLQVIRFDNWDVGLSTKFNEGGFLIWEKYIREHKRENQLRHHIHWKIWQMMWLAY